MNMWFFFLGLQRTSANIAAIFQPLSPVVVVALALIFRMERLDWRKGLGILLGVGGAAVMIGSGILHGGQSSVLGLIFLCANLFGANSYLLLMKRTYNLFTPLTLTMYQYFFGSFCTAFASMSCLQDGGAFILPGVDKPVTWWGLRLASSDTVVRSIHP